MLINKAFWLSLCYFYAPAAPAKTNTDPAKAYRMTDQASAAETPIAFSIVLPLYNKESSVYKTVQSILGQSHKLLQLVVVDDGSTDNSVEKLSEIQDSRLKLVRQANAGVSAARNAGVDASKHEYIAFIDADDLWHRDFLSVMSQLIQQHPERNYFATLWQPWSRHDDMPTDSRHYDSSKASLIDYIEASYNDVVAHICSTVVRKDAFVAVGGFPIGVKHYEDQDFMCKLARESQMLLYQEALVYYVRDADNRACDRRQVQDMPPFFAANEPLMLQSFPAGSADWHFKEYLISRYLAEVSLAAQTPGERGRAFSWLMLCRKTQKSRSRVMKGFVYLIMPGKLITALISMVSKKQPVQA